MSCSNIDATLSRGSEARILVKDWTVVEDVPDDGGLIVFNIETREENPEISTARYTIRGKQTGTNLGWFRYRIFGKAKVRREMMWHRRR